MSFEERISASLAIDQHRPHDSSRPPDIEALMRAYYPDVLRFAFSFAGSLEDAEDIAQETFIAAARGLDGFRGDSRVRTWLFGIAINLCRAEIRKRRRREALQLALLALTRLPLRPRSPEDRAVQHETSFELRQVVEKLDERHRLPVILHYIHDLPVPEIAALLGTKPGTVYSRLHYARKQLHHLIRLK